MDHTRAITCLYGSIEQHVVLGRLHTGDRRLEYAGCSRGARPRDYGWEYDSTDLFTDFIFAFDGLCHFLIEAVEELCKVISSAPSAQVEGAGKGFAVARLKVVRADN